MTEGEGGWGEGLQLLALKMEEGAMSQEMQGLLETGTGLFPKASRRNTALPAP